MLCALLAFCRADEAKTNCTEYSKSCMLCMQHSDACFYCFGQKDGGNACIDLVSFNETECSGKSREVDKKCVETLGGDAINRNRYIIGTCVLVLGILTDLIVRFCSKPQVKDEYAHL